MKFLKEIDAKVPEGLDVHIVLDNYAQDTQDQSVARPPAALPCPLHPDFRVMDQSGRALFAELTRKQIQRGVHTSVRQLEADIRTFIDLHNRNPKPFKWTKSADQILAPSNASATKPSRLYVANFRFT